MQFKSENVKKNVLLVISSMGQFPEIFRIAKMLNSTTQYEPIVYFNLGVFSGHPNVTAVLKENISVLDYNFDLIEHSRTKNLDDSKITNVIQSQQLEIQIKNGPNVTFKNLIKTKFPEVFEVIKKIVSFYRENLHALGLFFLIFQQLKRNRREKNFLRRLQIKLFVFAEDSLDYRTPFLIKTGHKLGIPSIVFPYTFANQFEFLEDAFFNNRTVNSGLFSFVIAKLFPKWTYFYKGKKLIKSTSSMILFGELFKVAPPNPWVMSSGYSDVIAVESLFMKDYYEKAGIHSSKMQITGYISLDQLYFVKKNKTEQRKLLAKKYGFDFNKKWVLCAVPPSQWPRAGVGFKTYAQFLNDFIQFTKSDKSVEVLFKFHPRLGESDIRKLCKDHSLFYVDEDTSDLIALADAYIASVSSTIRWALALGLPTINYDLYNYNYGDFEGAKNYSTVVTFNDFQSRYLLLVKELNDIHVTDTTQLQESYGLLDGHATKRIINLFDQLTEKVDDKVSI